MSLRIQLLAFQIMFFTLAGVVTYRGTEQHPPSIVDCSILVVLIVALFLSFFTFATSDEFALWMHRRRIKVVVINQEERE